MPTARGPDRHTYANQEQLQETRSRAAQRYHCTPECGGHRNDRHPIASIGPPRDRNSHQRVERSERQSAQEAELRIAQLEISFDALQNDAQCHPVEEVRRQDDHQQREQVSLVTSPGHFADRHHQAWLNQTSWRR
jgi:hypothetical protein